MHHLQELQSKLFEAVIEALVPGFARCISLQKEEGEEINTIVGIFTYVPPDRNNPRYRLSFNNEVVFAMPELRRKPTLGNVDDYTTWAEKEVLSEFVMGDYRDSLRTVVENVFPAKMGPEKVEVDYEDLQNLISLITAMAPGKLPGYVDNLHTQAKGCMWDKLKHLVDMPGHAEDKIGHAKRLTNLMEKFNK